MQKASESGRTERDFTPGSLYLIGFAQANAPHAGLIIPTTSSSGALVHIRIDRSVSPKWQYQTRLQQVEGDLFCTTLLKLHDVSDGAVSVAQLKAFTESVAVPDNGEFGECLPWVMRVIEKMGDAGVLQVADTDSLMNEFSNFAKGNWAFARRDRFPNVTTATSCY